MTPRVGVFFVDGSGEHLNGVQEEVAIFFGGVAKILDEVFEFFGHGVKSLREFSNFGVTV